MRCPAFSHDHSFNLSGNTMTFYLRRALLTMCALALTAPAWAGDIAAGKLKASTACAMCHGALGVSMMPNAPSLAAQPAIYLAEQLTNYRSGKRAHEVMGVIAKPLTDGDINNLAAWYASLQVEVRDPGAAK